MSGARRLAGRLLFAGFPGDSPATAPLDELAELRPGGIVLFARNIGDAPKTRALVEAIREAVGEPRLGVATDQEGGRVVRLRRDATQPPSAMAVARAAAVLQGDEPALRLNTAIANDLRRFGIGINFAPVADLANPRSAVLGTRASALDAPSVERYVRAAVAGLQRGGVAATLKHFPGHGLVAEDSHLALPRARGGAAEIDRHLAPFREGIAAGAAAVMVGHVVVTTLDPDRPASLSPAALRRLRENLGFRGAVFTDCLEMAAVAERFGTPAAAVAALAAGCDAVVISHRLEVARASRDAIVAAIDDGTLRRERLFESAARLEHLHERFGAEAAREPDGAALAAAIARAALLVAAGEVRLDAGRPVNVVSFEALGNDGIGSAETAPLHLALRRRNRAAESLRVALEPQPTELDALLDLVRAQSNRLLVVVVRGARFRPAQVAAVRALLSLVPALLLVAIEPFDLDCFPEAARAVVTFGDDEAAVEALADLLAGRT